MKLLGILKKLLFNGSPETSEKNGTLNKSPELSINKASSPEVDVHINSSLLHNKEVREISQSACLQNITPEESNSKSEMIELYGQVRTMADILIGLDEKYHFKDSRGAVDAVEHFIRSQQPCHFAISGKAFLFIADALYLPTAFVNGILNRDAFMKNFEASPFEEKWKNAMYRYYYAKIWKLICYFNEFRRYTSPEQIYKDLSNAITPEYYTMKRHRVGCPEYFFRRAIVEAWGKIAPNNSIDPQLLDEYMFKNYEASVRAVGLEETIQKYFAQDTCFTEVYLPKEVGSAPMYYERRVGNKRMFIKSCGDGIYPSNDPEDWEFKCAYNLLLEDSEYEILGSYVGWGNDDLEIVFVPKNDISLPVYIYNRCYDGRGKILFEDDEHKKNFISKAYKERFVIENGQRERLIKFSRL